MFTRKLNVLLKITERLLCSRLHSASFELRLNLIHPRKYDLKNVNASIKHNGLRFNAFRNSSNLSKTLESNNDDDDDDNSNNDINENNENSSDLKYSENTYAYNLLLNLKKHENTILPAIVPDENVSEDMVKNILEKDYEETSPQEVLNDFKLLSFYSKQNKNEILHDEKYNKILLTLKKYLQDYSVEEIMNLFRYIELWFPMRRPIRTAKNTPPYFQLVSALNDDLFNRVNDLKREDFLIFPDLFWRIRTPRITFISKAVKKLGKQVKTLTPNHYLQYMFIINMSRRPYVNMYELEYGMESIVDKFSADELGIVAMAFFKTETPLRNPTLINRILLKTISEMENMSDISICALFKIIRYSIGLKAVDLFSQLVHAFRPRIQDVSVLCLVHVAHAICSIQFYNKEIMDEIVERFQGAVPNSRIKDLERMLFTLMTYNYPKETPIYKMIIEEMMEPKRQRELNFHAKSVSTSLMYLSHVGIYPLSIIESVMHPDYLYEHYRNNAFKIGQDYLIIQCGLKIEEPNYNGPFLPDKVTKYLYKRWSTDDFNPDPKAPIFNHQRLLLEVINYLRDILGVTSFLMDQLLPHFLRHDIVFCLDKNGNFVSPKPHFPQAGCVGVIKHAPKDPEEHKWVVLVLAPKPATFNQTSILIGNFTSKLRQLEKIGYNTLTLTNYTWNTIKSIDERKNYLRSLLFSHDFNNTLSTKSP